MHYLNVLLDNLLSRDYKIEYNFLLFVLEFFYINTKSWRFESIFRINFRFQIYNSTRIFDFNFWNRLNSIRVEYSIRTR